jgi:hypothetical protein
MLNKRLGVFHALCQGRAFIAQAAALLNVLSAVPLLPI